MSLILDGTAGVTGPATKVIVGTTTNDSATAGYVGEYVESRVVQGSAVSLVTSTAKTITSISLTAGDWDVASLFAIDGNGSTNVTFFGAGPSSTNNTLSGSLDYSTLCFGTAGLLPFTTQDVRVTSPLTRFSLASTTTIYLVGIAAFTVSTCSGYGAITARRVR